MDRTQYRELLTDVAKKGHEIVMQMKKTENSYSENAVITLAGESDVEKLDSISKFIGALKAAETSIVDPVRAVSKKY